MTTYAYSCEGRLFISDKLEQPIPRDPAPRHLIAAWPGEMEHMPDEIRPMLNAMYWGSEQPKGTATR